MRIRVMVHEAAEGGFWAEAPSMPGCATQGETMEEIRANVREAVEGCLLAAGVEDGELFWREDLAIEFETDCSR